VLNATTCLVTNTQQRHRIMPLSGSFIGCQCISVNWI